jgi:Rrf2 family protein
MRISSTVDYAARVVLRLARLGAGETLTAERLAASEGISRDFVDQILLKLRRSGIVCSVRGSRGGYRLAKPARAVSLGMVMRAVEENVFDAVCERFAAGDRRCSPSSGCGLRPVWRKLGALVEAFLDALTVDALLAGEPCVSARMDMLFARSRGLSGRPGG